MLSNTLKIVCAVLFSGALLAQTGCACGTAKGACAQAKSPCDTPRSPCVASVKSRDTCDRPAGELSAALPPNARVGECYAKVFVPATFKTVSERILVREGTETIEIIPAKYEWVEEKVLVKDASTVLEAVPAEYATREQTIEVNSGYTGWEINKNALCENPKDQPARDIFCLVSHPSERKTVQTQYQSKPARVQTVCIPAQYDTVRREKLVSAASTRKVCTPAEYDTIEKTVKVCDGRMAWKLVACDNPEAEKVTANANRTQTIATVNAQRTQRP
ncbi:MAG TPA: hypothetical protein VJZ71_03750 [Phycisphaerae bacterium]|nr:hypothetical protein [Phycisphaerae bacterium]